MNFNVTNIEFDFDDDYADTVCNSDLDTFFIASEVDRKEVTDRHLGVWEADDEDDLIEEITAATVSYTHLRSPRDLSSSRMPSSA